MNKKTPTGIGRSSVIFGVAFVWFTTHFGGGFASGAQIYSYYVRYGIWCLLMPALAMLYNGIFFAYGMRFARRHNVYDYRSYNNAFYGKFAPVFSNLFEILYICVMCVAPAVAFATGGATLSALTGLPYLLCTLMIGIFIFVVAIFGTDLVRCVASVLSVCIIAGLLIVYIPNIIHGWPTDGRYQCPDAFDRAKWHWKRIYDTAHLHPDHPWCRLHRSQYGCCHGQACV